MRYLTPILAAIATISLVGCAGTTSRGAASSAYDFQSVDQVAVVAVEGGGASEAATNQISDMFSQVLLKKGYQPVGRSQVQELIAEQDFQLGPRTSNTDVAQLGKILNVDAVIMVNIPQYGNKLSLSAEMLDVDTAAIVWSATGTARSAADSNELLGGVLGGVFGAAVADDHPIAGGVVGGAVGTVAGRQMTPQRQKQAFKLIRKMTETLPAGV